MQKLAGEGEQAQLAQTSDETYQVSEELYPRNPSQRYINVRSYSALQLLQISMRAYGVGLALSEPEKQASA